MSKENASTIKSYNDEYQNFIDKTTNEVSGDEWNEESIRKFLTPFGLIEPPIPKDESADDRKKWIKLALQRN